MFLRKREGLYRGSLPPLLWLHGLGESGLCFERIIEHPLFAEWTILVPDLPSYGRSAWTREPLSLVEHVDQLADWLRQRDDVSALPVIGHSMGGVLAIMLAERHPSLVRAVVDVDGNKSLGDCTYSSQATAQTRDAFLSGGFDAYCDRIHRGGVDRAMRGYYASLRHCDPRAFYRNSEELVELSTSETLVGRLAALEVPSVFVAGVPGGACRRSRELLDDAGVNVLSIQPSGHWPFLDQPDQFAETLRDWLLSSG